MQKVNTGVGHEKIPENVIFTKLKKKKLGRADF
jgi:hypothetical protein